RNQFRPIFSDKKSILPRQSIDFSTAVPHDRPQPKAKPPVKTRKAVVKKKNKKKRKKGALPRKRKGVGSADPSNPRPTSATAADRRLRKLHITKALTVGSIQANIKRMDQISVAESKLLSDRLRSTVAILNAIQMHMYEAIALDIARLVRSKDTATDVTQRKEDIADILDSKAFYFALNTLLCSGQEGRGSQAVRVSVAPARRMSTRNTPLVPGAPQPQAQAQAQA
ncbi:hypothetical protein BGZ54_005462, partial [Gamsiella multidivaricata]